MIHLSKKRTNPLAHLLVVIDREDNINKMQCTRKMPSNTELKLAVIVTKTILALKMHFHALRKPEQPLALL